MPTYSYQCQFCGYQFDMSLSMNEMERPIHEPCPKCNKKAVNQIITSATPISDPHRMGRIKPDDTWRSFLRNLKDKNPGSNINTFD